MHMSYRPARERTLNAHDPCRHLRRRVTRTILTGVLLTATVGLAACSSSGSGNASSNAPTASTSPGSAGARVDATAAAEVPAQYRGGISVAVQANIAPLNYVDSSGNETGLDLDLLNAISAELGVKITVHPVTFENLILGLNSGKYDFVADTTVTSAREVTYDMLSYLQSSYSTGTLKTAGKLADSETALCGKHIGIVTGEVIAQYITSIIDPECSASVGKISTSEYPSFSTAVLAAQANQIAAVVVDTGTYGYFLKTGPGSQFEYNGPSKMQLSPAGYSFLKSNSAAPQLAKAVQTALSALISDGTYHALFAEYGQEQATVASPVLNPVVASS
jgi:polar amino acid transport system substrate-binding protein